MMRRNWVKVVTILAMGILTMFLIIRRQELQIAEVYPAMTKGSSHRALSPDEKRLAFVKGGNLFVMDLVTGGTKLVYESPPGSYRNLPEWNADGTKLAFNPEPTQSKNYPQYRIWDSQTESILALPQGRFLTWSNDPLVFTLYDRQGATLNRIKGLEVITITELEKDSEAAYVDLDEGSVIYLGRASRRPFGKTNLRLGRSQEEVLGTLLAVSPSGDKVAYSTRLGTWVIDVDSWKDQLISEKPAIAARWSPDGKKLAVMGGFQNVFIFDFETRRAYDLRGSFTRNKYQIDKDLGLQWTEDSRRLRFVFSTMGGAFFVLPARNYIYDYNVGSKRGRVFSIGWGNMLWGEWASSGKTLHYDWVPFSGRESSWMKATLP